MQPTNRQPKIRISLRKTFLIFVHLFLFAVIAYPVHAEDEPKPIGIDEKLGETVPMDLTFYDEYGKTITLGELIDGKPTIISIVYYRCPGLCSPLLVGLADVVDKVDLEPGKDFNVLTFSMDPREDYLLAAEKKKNYLHSMTREMPETSWRFLTGDSVNANRITEVVGWNYEKQGDDFMHGASIVVVSPEGKIARYLYGTEYLAFDLKMAIIEASEGKVGPTISKLMQICFSYDPEGRGYVLDVTRISGGIVIFLIGVFAVIFLVKKKKSPETNNVKEINKEQENG